MLTADDVVTAHFSATRFRPGYRQDEVDGFLDRVAGTLRARAGGSWSADIVTAEEAARVAFGRTSVMPGYDPAEVDAFLAEVVVTLSAAPEHSEAAAHVRAAAPVATGGARAGRVLVEMVVGERPDARPTKVPRVRRVAARYVRVDAAGVHWRTWRAASGTVPASSITTVELVEVVLTGQVDSVSRYALLLDRSGAALLRVGVDGSGGRPRSSRGGSPRRGRR